MLPMATVTCPECEYYFGSGIVAADGRGVQHVDGELIELTPEIIAQHREERSRQVHGARSREELMQIARSRGYSPRWVDHIMAARGRRRA